MRTMHVVDGFLNLLRLGVLACVAAVAACSPRSDNAGVASGPDAVLGIWVPDAAPQRLLAVNGSPAPLTPEAARRACASGSSACNPEILRSTRPRGVLGPACLA